MKTYRIVEIGVKMIFDTKLDIVVFKKWQKLHIDLNS